jgi:Domain of Unknown Function (DUF928)
MISIHRLKPFTLTIALSLAMVEVLSIPFAHAPYSSSLAARPSLQAPSQQRPTVRPPSGRPRRTIGGGSRGQCPPVELGATAFIPLTETKTLSDRPTFWFYSPYRGKNRSAKFTIEQAGELITDPLMMTLPLTPGLLKVQLPKTVSLNPDQSYRWFLTIDCNPDQAQSSPAQSSPARSTYAPQPPLELEGSVRRITLAANEQQNLASLTPNSREQFDFYVAKNLWLEAIALTLDRPQPKRAQWELLLKMLDLQEFSAVLP